jgi:hypothetical protein
MNTMTTTNANSTILAATLAAAPERATFTSVITRKQGTERGGVRYGDDLVHAVLVTGFRYDRLVERSRAMLATFVGREAEIAADLAGRPAFEGRGSKQTQVSVTEAHVKQALAELETSFATTLDPTAPSESTTAHVYEPLVVDGESVRGGRVYKCAAGVAPECHCRTCTGEAKAPLPGTIYIQGLQIGRKVIDPAPNGPVPASKSGPVVVAKDYLRGKLPVSRYVSYRLEPGTDFLLRVGGTAAVKADADGIHLSPELVEVVTAA